MKYALAVLMVLFSFNAWAAPFLTSDVTTDNPDGFIVVMDGQTITHPGQAVTGGKRVHHDLQGIAPGTYSGTIIEYKMDPIWGRLESSTPTPFSFVKPANLQNVTGVGLSAE